MCPSETSSIAPTHPPKPCQNHTSIQVQGLARMVLTQEEIDACRAAFMAMDQDRSGTIDVWQLRQVLESLGQRPTEEELFQMISEVDTAMSGAIDFYDLLRVVEAQQARAEGFDDEGDMVDAFVACGGRADKTGHVRRETLVKVGGICV